MKKITLLLLSSVFFANYLVIASQQPQVSDKTRTSGFDRHAVSKSQGRGNNQKQDKRLSGNVHLQYTSMKEPSGRTEVSRR